MYTKGMNSDDIPECGCGKGEKDLFHGSDFGTPWCPHWQDYVDQGVCCQIVLKHVAHSLISSNF